jgi:hypothetical protein
MDDSANRVRRRLAGAVLALFLCAAQASGHALAQEYAPPPTLAEAHAFLADTFNRYSIGYIVWHGARGSARGRAGYYGGRDCLSEIGTGSSRRAFAVDWSLISAVERSGPDALYVIGQLVRPVDNPEGRRDANFHLYFPNAAVSRSVQNAFELLRGSCRQRSRFD